jgi:predicted glycoside hydrolase/deacetylase ChbG (UPF0249 family)
LTSRILIINADDLGYARGINEAIVRCANLGVLRSATLMANGGAFEHAVSVVRAAENLRVGVHLVLTDLHPVSNPRDVAGLVTEEGRLPQGPTGLLAAMVRGRVSLKAMRRELSLQVEKVLDHGIRPTHLDSHKHVHVVPQVLDAVIHVAKRYSIPWIRNPFDATGNVREILAGMVTSRRVGLFSAWGQSRMLRILKPRFMRSVRRAGLRTPRRFYGTALTGLWDIETVRRVFRTLPLGINEWMVHPGDADDELKRIGTRLLFERERERDLLLSAELQRFLSEHFIVWSSFGDEPPYNRIGADGNTKK